MDGFQNLFCALICLDFIPRDGMALFLLICLVLVLIVVLLMVSTQNGHSSVP
jgi:cell division protein FtsW (lipid II flippase)